VSIKRISAIVSGRVQGVYYRASTETEARRLGVTGWVRNLSNGDVEFEAEGPEDVIDELIKWAYQGPEMAQVNYIETTHIEVTHIEVTNTTISNENHSFDIHY
jgi:acylphosphatase